MDLEKTCNDLIENLAAEWDNLRDGERVYRAKKIADNGCKEVIPYLALLLDSEDPYSRNQALRGLSDLEGRDYRQIFIHHHINDPDEEVRKVSLIELGEMYRGEGDHEILRLALSAFDDPDSSVGMMLHAGATMMYQLNIPEDELGGPGWWNEEEEDLQHPSIQRAVEETRNLLKSEGV